MDRVRNVQVASEKAERGLTEGRFKKTDGGSWKANLTCFKFFSTSNYLGPLTTHFYDWALEFSLAVLVFFDCFYVLRFGFQIFEILIVCSEASALRFLLAL